MKTKTKIIRNAMIVIMLCAMLISEAPYSLMQAVGLGDIPANVYASSGDPGIVEGSGVLAGSVNVNTAQTVYYAGTGWRVISYGNTGNYVLKSADKLTLLASNSLAACRFNPDYIDGANHYNGSTLQSVVDNWYNTNFSAKEKISVTGHDLTTGGYKADPPYTNGVAGNEVKNAKLWPLSSQEAFYTGKGNDADTLTDDQSFHLRYIYGSWWLRSPGMRMDQAAEVDGWVYADGIFPRSTAYTDGGVRPAFMLNLSPILFTSAASDSLGKPAGNIGTLSAVNNNNGSEWKLTLLDDGTIDGLNGHAGFTASRIDSGNVNAGSNIRIKYSGAQSGNNEYVSACLKDSDGRIRYYGHLATNSSSGTAALTMPNDIYLEEGSYTVGVFAEQCNGDKKTDYASKVTEIPVTIATHKHDFTYAAGTEDNADTITAICSGADIPCPWTDRKFALTINKPKHNRYSDLENAHASLSGLSDFTTSKGFSFNESNITYKGIEDTDYAESTTPPVDAGKYRAKITLNGVKTAAGDKQSVTAYVDYEIAKGAAFIGYALTDITKTVGDKPFINDQFLYTGDGTVTYTSSDENVATVDTKGEVTIVGPGTAVITASAADGKNYTYPYALFRETSYNLTVKEKSDNLSAGGNPESLMKTRLTSVKAKKGGKAVVRWKKNASVGGYQLYYKAKGVKARKLTVKNAKTVKATVKKLKVGKTYSFRIRTFTKVKKLKNGKIKTIKQYGKWSNVIKIRAKK